MFKYLFLFYSFLLINFTYSQTELQLPKVFSDNMVLQRESEVNIWGKGEKNATVFVEASWGVNSSATTDDNGFWKLKLKTIKAGGPYRLTIKSGNSTIRYSNILLGDVWLCSGQSNMEMPMKGWLPSDTIFGAKQEIASGGNKNIRFFTVQRKFSINEEDDVNGVWSECNSASIGEFSATAYFFGKSLSDKINIPIGLIHSSWGGTPVEAWTPKSALINFEKYNKILTQFIKLDSINRNFNSWLTGLNRFDIYKSTSEDRWKNIDLGDSRLSQPEDNNANWKPMSLPTAWERTEIGDFDGVIWFKREVSIPNSFVNKELRLNLGPIDDMDATYVNGEKIGSTEVDGKWNENRNYLIPADLTKSGKLTIAIRVIDNTGGGGIYGNKNEMYIATSSTSDKIDISGEWKYLPVAEFKNGSIYYWGLDYRKFADRPKLPFNLTATTSSVLFNGMIKPLIPFNIKGSIWYQGESNTDYPADYTDLFSSMINSWRNKWGSDFSFYFTQIAPYRYAETVNSALIREAQLKSLSIPKTGMAVTLDIGNTENIHPGNKKEVGRRLALCALANDYKIDTEFSGPLFTRYYKTEGKLHLVFNHSEGLAIKEINHNNNIWLSTIEGKIIDTKVQITGNEIVVDFQDNWKDFTLNYCFDNISEATIFNKAGLPAPSFRIAIE